MDSILDLFLKICSVIMTVKNAIKILDWWISHKNQGMDELKTKWNYQEYDKATGVAKMIFELDKTILHNLEKIRNELVPNCKHPKKMRDRDPNGGWYCMNCKWTSDLFSRYNLQSVFKNI